MARSRVLLIAGKLGNVASFVPLSFTSSSLYALGSSITSARHSSTSIVQQFTEGRSGAGSGRSRRRDASRASAGEDGAGTGAVPAVDSGHCGADCVFGGLAAEVAPLAGGLHLRGDGREDGDGRVVSVRVPGGAKGEGGQQAARAMSRTKEGKAGQNSPEPVAVTLLFREKRVSPPPSP